MIVNHALATVNLALVIANHAQASVNRSLTIVNLALAIVKCAEVIAISTEEIVVWGKGIYFLFFVFFTASSGFVYFS